MSSSPAEEDESSKVDTRFDIGSIKVAEISSKETLEELINSAQQALETETRGLDDKKQRRQELNSVIEESRETVAGYKESITAEENTKQEYEAAIEKYAVDHPVSSARDQMMLNCGLIMSAMGDPVTQIIMQEGEEAEVSRPGANSAVVRHPLILSSLNLRC